MTLLKIQNGGYVSHEFDAFPTDVPTSWAEDHVWFRTLAGIGPADAWSSVTMNAGPLDEWKMPAGLVLLSGEGHFWIALDYRGRAPEDEPSVIWFDNEVDEDLTIAPSFLALVEGLVPMETFAVDDPDTTKGAWKTRIASVSRALLEAPVMISPVDDQAPGWDAIDAAMKAVHGDVEPVHKGLAPGVAFGSPLQGISAYAEGDHWHYVTYGLTELFAKESDVAEISGFGYELTMRVPRGAQDSPPDWPFGLLANVAAAARAGNDFAVGHRLQVGGPITGDTGCVMEAVAFVSDPSLPVWTLGPNGSFEFYELVGITPDELAEMQASSTASVVARLAESNTLLITDPTRS